MFNAIVDEFGSTLNSTVENSCMNSIISYMNVAKGTGTHAPFTSWFYWCAFCWISSMLPVPASCRKHCCGLSIYQAA